VDISVEVGGSPTELALVAPGPAPAPGQGAGDVPVLKNNQKIKRCETHCFDGERLKAGWLGRRPGRDTSPPATRARARARAQLGEQVARDVAAFNLPARVGQLFGVSL
jgi:hypothetical protein